MNWNDFVREVSRCGFMNGTLSPRSNSEVIALCKFNDEGGKIRELKFNGLDYWILENAVVISLELGEKNESRD